MDEYEKWRRLGIDIDQPSAARAYDYYLGGGNNFAVDRALAEQVRLAVPWVNETARHNRAFLRRAVRFCIDSGIRQFLDIGSGTPTVGNVHEIAQQADPTSRVVYVDNEPVAVAHSRILLEGTEGATIVQADLRNPDKVCDSEQTRQLIDFDQPVAVLMVAILHFIPPSDNPLDIIAEYRRRMVPGSFLAISHVTDDVYPDQIHKLVELYQSSSNPVTPRTRSAVRELFTGFDLVEPGLVWTQEWHPETAAHVDEHPETSMVYAGVGRRP